MAHGHWYLTMEFVALKEVLDMGGNAAMIGLLFLHIKHHTRLTILETTLNLFMKQHGSKSDGS